MFQVGDIVIIPTSQGQERLAKILRIDDLANVAQVGWQEKTGERHKNVNLEHLRLYLPAGSQSEEQFLCGQPPLINSADQQTDAAEQQNHTRVHSWSIWSLFLLVIIIGGLLVLVIFFISFISLIF
jgi:hypothetical protein